MVHGSSVVAFRGTAFYRVLVHSSVETSSIESLVQILLS